MRKYFLLIITVLFCACVQLQAQQSAEWTLLNYIEADNNVAKHALFNIAGMKRVGSNEKVNILVQLDEPKHKKTWRYKIMPGGITDDASLNKDMGLKPRQELQDAAQWAYSTYPSEYTMLTLWNHGNGILDEKRGWKDYPTRGILYDFTNETYLTNQDLKNALRHITSKTLKRKIDIIGMDACLMAMVEVAYQVKDYARYFVASQNIEISPGWYYYHYLKRLAFNVSSVPPVQLAKSIVSSFMLLNRHRNNISTQSVTDLEHIEKLKIALDHLAQKLISDLEAHPQKTRELIAYAHKKSLSFDKGRYVDIATFCMKLLGRLKKLKLRNKYAVLEKAVIGVLDALDDVIVLTQSGPRFARAGGLSIYFPKDAVHESYIKCDFGKTSVWTPFLKRYLKVVA